MPELPDLTVVADALHAALAGRPVGSAAAPAPLAVRGTPAELAGLVGQGLVSIRRRGKFLVMDLERDRVIINPMLTGRFQLAAPGARQPPKTALILGFGPRPGPPTDPEPWTVRATWLPADAALAELRYRDSTQMGKVYVVPSGVEREVAGFGPGELGPDADDPALDLETWRARIRAHHGELKSILRNQAFVAGIGNAYSDEILWAAGLEPFRKRASLAPEESERLWRATRDVLAWAVDELRQRVPPRFEVQARDFLRVHLKGGQACPRCGTTLSEVSPGGFVTTWCRSCQA